VSQGRVPLSQPKVRKILDTTQVVNEVLGTLVTEFVRNFGREGATSYQRSNVSILDRVQVDELIRHNALRHLRAASHRPCVRTCLLVAKKPAETGVKKYSSDIGCAIN
jgi:hypothetical protein